MDTAHFLRAALRGDAEPVQAFLDAGGDVNVTSAKGMTALMCCVWQGDHVNVARRPYGVRTDPALSATGEKYGWEAASVRDR